MPLTSSVEATPVEIDDIQESIGNILSDKISFKKAYDIKIVYAEKEYEPTDFDTNVKVTISGVDQIDEKNQKYKVVHIEEKKDENENTVKDVKEIDSVQISENAISFPADSFSTYAVLLEDGLNPIKTYSSNLDNASVWNGTDSEMFRFGSGTSTEPYLITNASELRYLAVQVNNGTDYDGTYFTLISASSRNTS